VQPLQLVRQLWLLAHPHDLRGQSGYWLTVFEAALQFVRTCPLPPPPAAAPAP